MKKKRTAQPRSKKAPLRGKSTKSKDNAAKDTSRKGMAIETMGKLILAVVSLIVLWVILNAIAPEIGGAVVNLAKGLICALCRELLGAWKNIFSFCWGCPT